MSLLVALSLAQLIEFVALFLVSFYFPSLTPWSPGASRGGRLGSGLVEMAEDLQPRTMASIPVGLNLSRPMRPDPRNAGAVRSRGSPV